jgi:hypothetical protein
MPKRLISFLFIRSADDQIVNSQIQTKEAPDSNLDGNEDAFSQLQGT